MKKAQPNQFTILGLGSIGKRHSEFVASLDGEIICIDPNEDARKWCANNIDKAHVFSNLQEASKIISNFKGKKIGIISNWGTLHYSSALELIELGVLNLYIEKPIVNSLLAIDSLLNLNGEIKLIGGFQNRYTNIDNVIKEVSRSRLGGKPSMISVNGGAAGIVTNGIHYLDLAISIFGSPPDSVISNLSSSNINPRSQYLDFWEGSASWNFPGGRMLVINFTNLSSVKASTEIFCPVGKIKLNEDMSINIFERDQDEIKADNRIIRLGVAKQITQVHYRPENNNLFTRIFDPFFDDSLEVDMGRELDATKAMIYALASNKIGKKLFLETKLDKELYEFEWQIS